MRFVILYSLGKKYDKTKIGAHIRYLKKMAEEGKNLMSGGFVDDPGNRGLAIIELKDENEAKTFLQQDPCIQTEVLHGELIKWNVMFEKAK
jgi:uncharacterized protein YciI